MPDYTLFYVYQLSDFDTSGSLDAVPDEQGARAEGNPPWQLQLDAGASPIPITVTDDDTVFDEIGGNDQVLTFPVTIDGVTYPAGETVIINYVITTDSGFVGYSLTIGENNTGNNTTTAFITTEPMTPGQTYEFTSEDNVGTTGISYTEFVCFAAGTMIRTPQGPRKVESLVPGDLVSTLDCGSQPLRWIGSRTMPAIGRIAPIRIEAGILGATDHLTVSPNHRILISGAEAELLLGQSETLVPAKALENGKTIRSMPTGFITYVHLMFDQHQIIWANGCLAESLFLGQTGLQTMTSDQANELREIFPELCEEFEFAPMKPARHFAKAFEGKVLATTV